MSINDYQLQHDRIDIWEFPLDELPVGLDLPLNQEELARADRYYFERHSRRFRVARTMLRVITSRYLQQEAKQLSFSFNQHGKPSLNHSQFIEFNLSHSGDLALLAIGQKYPLGIDLEFFSARPYDGIAKMLFSPEELRVFLNLPTLQKPFFFFKIWAQKEAFIKACGLGLSYPTKKFTVPLFLTTPSLIKDTLHQKEWLIKAFMPKITCFAALCYHPSVKEIRYSKLAKTSDLF